MGEVYCSLVEFLYTWQTLAGALLGGLVGLGAALIVAYSTARQSDLSAAMHIYGTLADVCGAHKAKALAVVRETHELNELAAKFGAHDPSALSHSLEIIEKFRKLSQLFEVSMARVLRIDPPTAAHLHYFGSRYSEMEKKLDRLAKDIWSTNKKGSSNGTSNT